MHQEIALSVIIAIILCISCVVILPHEKKKAEVEVGIRYVFSTFIFLFFMRIHDSDTQLFQWKETQAKRRFRVLLVQCWFCCGRRMLCALSLLTGGGQDGQQGAINAEKKKGLCHVLRNSQQITLTMACALCRRAKSCRSHCFAPWQCADLLDSRRSRDIIKCCESVHSNCFFMWSLLCSSVIVAYGITLQIMVR